MEKCKLKNVVVGTNRPKVCARLIGHNIAELISEAKYFASSKGEIAEWRLDFFENGEDLSTWVKAAKEIESNLNRKPLVVSYRSQGFLGKVSLSLEKLRLIYQHLIESGYVSGIDLALTQGKDFIEEMRNYAHEHDVAVNITGLYEKKTMNKDEMVKMMIEMQNYQVDTVLLAVTPHTNQDVLLLLEAVDEMKQKYAEVPIAGMANTNKGIASQIVGETFGSSICFGAAMKASDYGQLSVDDLYTVINLLHMNGMH